MPKRLQVILQDAEYPEIQRAARSRQMSIAEWVRQALAYARRREPLGDVEKKLAAVRAAVKHEFPTGDIETMLAGIDNAILERAKRIVFGHARLSARDAIHLAVMEQYRIDRILYLRFRIRRVPGDHPAVVEHNR